MSRWTHPLDPGTVTGHQTLTGAKPITEIHRAVKELQDAVVADASIVINGEALSCHVQGNKLVASGQIPLQPKGSGKKIVMITGVTPILTNTDDSLTLTLAFTAVELDTSTGDTSDVDMPDAVCTLNGEEC